MGRPSKMTPETQAKLLQAIGAGNYYEAACSYAGIRYRTFALWMRRGKKSKKGRYFQFFHAVRQAESQAEVAIVAQWRQHIPEDYHAARDFLERRFPKRWGRKDKTAVEHTGRVDSDVTSGGKPLFADYLAPQQAGAVTGDMIPPAIAERNGHCKLNGEQET